MSDIAMAILIGAAILGIGTFAGLKAIAESIDKFTETQVRIRVPSLSAGSFGITRVDYR